MGDKYHRVLGIDLGTTRCVVAAYNTLTEAAEILLDNRHGGALSTPSAVSLRGGEVLVGGPAWENFPHDPAGTVLDIKREMGAVLRPDTAASLDAAGAAVGRDGDPVRVCFAGQWLLPQEIAALLLMRVKQIAEESLGAEVRDAVLTVPVSFTERQRRAVEEAALLAGLYPRQLLPEPVATAVCYGADRPEPARQVYLVYDLGGGSFDVSVVGVEGGRVDVLGIAGDPRLGGRDFDDLLAQWALERLRLAGRADAGDLPRQKSVLRYHAERLKRELSTSQTARLVLPELRPENPPVLEVTRADFERLIGPLLDRTLEHVETALTQAEQGGGLRRDQIDAVLLVGGSSKIPCVRARLLDYFQKGEDFVRADCDPDLVVARGAALAALRFSPSPLPFDMGRKGGGGLNATPEQEVLVQEIAEHSLGLAVEDGGYHRLIERGTRLPASVTLGNLTNRDPAQTIDLQVYQGEAQHALENTLLGTVRLGPMEEKPAGGHLFEVTFSLDESGLLDVLVHHVNEGKKYQAPIDRSTATGGSTELKLMRDRLLRMYQGRGDPAGSTAPTRPPAPAPLPAMQPAPAAEIPEEFRQTVRRVQDLLRRQPVPRLRQALDSFLAALAAGAADRLADLGDTLADVFDEVRRSPPANPEPAREVPEQFKSIVRRAQKQLLKQADPRLQAALNGFITALNDGAPEEDLLELGDTLGDVYDEVRRGSPAAPAPGTAPPLSQPGPSSRAVSGGPVTPDPTPAPALAAQPLPRDENVQFTVYRPRAVAPGVWYPLLAFAHLTEKRPGAPAHEPDPVQEVQRQASRVLGERQAREYQPTTQDARQAVPRHGLLTLVPEVDGVEFNPPRRSFYWEQPVHREEFQLRAGPGLEGQTARGRLSVFLGDMILADVALALPVRGGAPQPSAAEEVPGEHEHGRPYRKIFASYSHRDLRVVEQFEYFARTLGDQYLRDWQQLRAGEVWDERLLRLIEEADVFQLFWSRNTMESPYVRQEWEHALSLNRPHFVRPTYWEEPLPADPARGLPPEQLLRIHFQRIALGVAASPPAAAPERGPAEGGDKMPPASGGAGAPPAEPDDEVSLVRTGVGGGDSGISLRDPADSGVSLVKGDDDGFELSLDDSPSESGAGAPPADDSSEFELTLDDPGDNSPLDESGDRDVFDTDFDVPPLEEESGSEAVALDDDADLESSDFDLALGDEDTVAEDESGSQVVALEDEEADEGAATVQRELRGRGEVRAAAEEDEESSYAAPEAEEETPGPEKDTFWREAGVALVLLVLALLLGVLFLRFLTQ